ncbi:MAG: serine/threonine protein kinase [Planctomycetes bacterium]|nr:serine/threonine protein kinase [Planctomycetota bacterium]
MNSIAACDQCGHDYEPTDLLRGLCPACLFAHALPDGDSVSDAAWADGLSGVRFAPPKINDLTPHFPQLDIRELAGQGGMSAVYRAHHPHLNRTVALKVLPKEIAEIQGGAERFKREAQTLAQLSHANIVNVYDSGQAGPWCYIVMEFVQGPNLRQLLGESKLATSDVLRIVSGVCDGLQYAHDQGVVHRDVKPENVLLDCAGHVKLVDFGLAKLLNPPPSSDSVTRTHQVMGTPYYLAPEQAETPANVDHRADLYSLGVMMYEMLTGELPLGHFDLPSQRIGSDPALDAVVLQAMSKDPHRRYQQARDLQRSMTSPPTVKPMSGKAKTRPRWHGVVNELILSACSLVTALAACFVLMGLPAESRYDSPERPSTRNSEEIRAPATARANLHARFRAVGKRVGMSLPLFVISFLLSRVNVSSATQWRDLSPVQNLCVPVLVTAYVVIGFVVLIGPGLLILLFESLPLIADLGHWSAFGRTIAESDRNSIVTPYWFRVYGVAALTSASWCMLLASVLRTRPNLVRRLLHPSDDHTTAVTARTASYSVGATLLLAGLLLLYAVRLAEAP